MHNFPKHVCVFNEDSLYTSYLKGWGVLSYMTNIVKITMGMEITIMPLAVDQSKQHNYSSAIMLIANLVDNNGNCKQAT